MAIRFPMLLRKRHIVTGFCLFLLLLFPVMIEAISAVREVHVVKGDGNYFFPIVYIYSQTGHLFHPFWSPISDNPNNMLIWHGWLMPVIQGKSFISDRYSMVYLSGILYFIPTLVLYFILYYNLYGYWHACGSMPILLSLLMYQNGRPELISSIIMLIFIFCIYFIRLHTTLLGCSLGLFAITSPTLFIITAFFAIMLILNQEGRFLLLVHKVTTTLVIACLFLLITTEIALESNVIEWLTGIWKHARVIASRGDSDGFTRYFVFNLEFPILIIYIILLAMWSSEMLARYRLGFYLPFLLVFIVSTLYSSVRIPATSYNLAALIPLIICMAYDIQKNNYFRFTPKIVNVLVSAAAVAATLSIVHRSAMLILTLQNGRNATVIQETLQDLPANATVAFTSFSFALLADSVLEKHQVLFTDTLEQSDFRVEGQAHSGRVAPNLQPGECVFYSNYHSSPPMIFRFPIARTYKDWSFALIGSCSHTLQETSYHEGREATIANRRNFSVQMSNTGTD